MMNLILILLSLIQYNLIKAQSSTTCFSPDMIEECINTIRYNIQKCPPNDYSCMCNLSRGFNSCLGTGPHCSSESAGLNLIRMTESESQSYCTANNQIIRQNAGAVTINDGSNGNSGPTPVYPILANIPLATDPSTIGSLPPNILNRNSVTRLPFGNSEYMLNINYCQLLSIITSGIIVSSYII